jgi:hypothetical protein
MNKRLEELKVEAQKMQEKENEVRIDLGFQDVKKKENNMNRINDCLDLMTKNIQYMNERLEELKVEAQKMQEKENEVRIDLGFQDVKKPEISKDHYYSNKWNNLLFFVEDGKKVFKGSPKIITLCSIKSGGFYDCLESEFDDRYKKMGIIENKEEIDKFRELYAEKKRLKNSIRIEEENIERSKNQILNMKDLHDFNTVHNIK